jgi:hypothetical protein
VTPKREESGRPPPRKRGELLKIELSFDDALQAALKTPPPPQSGKRSPENKSSRRKSTG